MRTASILIRSLTLISLLSGCEQRVTEPATLDLLRETADREPEAVERAAGVAKALDRVREAGGWLFGASNVPR